MGGGGGGQVVGGAAARGGCVPLLWLEFWMHCRRPSVFGRCWAVATAQKFWLARGVAIQVQSASSDEDVRNASDDGAMTATWAVDKAWCNGWTQWGVPRETARLLEGRTAKGGNSAKCLQMDGARQSADDATK